jgi:hypothetical protein
MTYQVDDVSANAMLDAYETSVGTTPVLRIFTGAPPANCAAANSGTLLSTINLPSDWLTTAAARTKTISGVWQDSNTDDVGTAGHFRLYQSNGTTCRGQGTVTVTGGGGELQLNSVTFALGQFFSITAVNLSM